MASVEYVEPSELRRIGRLLVSLTWRDLRVRYKQSALGVAWAVLLPLSMMLIFTFVFTRATDLSAATGLAAPYALFAYTGLAPWAFFSSSINGCVNSLVANRNLVTKAYFPREAFPLSCIGASFVDFIIAMTVLAGLMAYFHWRGAWTMSVSVHWVFVPVIVLVQISLTAGLGMILAMANLFYRDVRQAAGVALQLGLFVSAVVVPAPTGDSLAARLVRLNPLVAIMEGYRDCLLHGRWPSASGFAYATAASCVVLVAGWVVFRRASHRFAECI